MATVGPMRLPATVPRALVPALAALAALATSGSARAAAAGGAEAARLDTERSPGAEACPDATALEALVAERLGSSPFREQARRTIRVRFEAVPNAGGFRADVTLADDADAVVGTRALASAASDCTELADSVVLTIAILLDRPAPEAPAPAVGPPEPPPEPPTFIADVPPPNPPTPPVLGRESRLSARVGAGLLVVAGAAPAGNVGVYFGAGLGRASWSVELEGRVDLPASAEYTEGSVRTALRLAQIVPCYHRGPTLLCFVGGAGVTLAEGLDVASPQTVTSFYAHVGGRAGFEAPLGDQLALRLAADVLVPLTHTTVAIGDADLWTTPPVAIALVAGAIGRFP